ncbi:MAG TPA: hypothetical protein VKP65_09890 [Rhodothermales bacterium]|nr:hypothetical protein [Rhodothermales bacterium]
MRKTIRILIMACGFLFGVAFGLWYIGFYFDSQPLVDPQVILDMSDAEKIQAITTHPEMFTAKTYVTIFGLGGWWVDGDWPFWLTLLLSSGVFTWIAYRITCVLLKP